MRSYELMCILDPNLDEEGLNALTGKIDEVMTKEGIEVEKTEPWGKRRLAYAIKGNWEGNYILSYLNAEPEAVSEMERRLRVTEGVLRFLTVRMDEQRAKMERRKARLEEKGKARKANKQNSLSEETPIEATKPTAQASANVGDGLESAASTQDDSPGVEEGS